MIYKWCVFQIYMLIWRVEDVRPNEQAANKNTVALVICLMTKREITPRNVTHPIYMSNWTNVQPQTQNLNLQ